MGYLDYAGLSYFWGKLKEKFAPKSHNHDDRYYTESEMNAKLAGKLNLSGGTMTGQLHVSGTAASKPLQVRGVVGCDSDGVTDGELHLQYGVNAPIKLGKDASYSISADGGTYTGKASTAGTADVANSVAWDKVGGKPSTFTPSAHNQAWSTITDTPALMTASDYSAETIEALLKKVQGTYPKMGSAAFTKDTHVANTWWNFIYTPHRTGVGGDNGDYGTLLLFPMTGNGSSYIIRAGKGGVVSDIRKIYTSGDKPSKSDVGLGSVDNTADANKSVKYATSAGSATKATSADSATSSTTSKGLQLLSSSRSTSMNFNLAGTDYKSRITYSIATSSTTEGKPPKDANVLSLGWDNSGYGSQVAVGNDSIPRMYVRGATTNNGASKWDESWKTVAYTDDKPATAGTADVANSVDWSKVQNKPTTYPATSHTHPYLPISGGTVTGNTAITGSYLQVPMITGETSNDISGTAQIKKAHGIQLGIPNRDYCNFYEYGGVWNFYKTKDSYTQESGDGVLIAKIDTNGVHANLIGTANSAKALSTTVTLTGGDGNTTGYRLVAQCGIGQWTNNRSMFFVKSRHQGSGFVVVTIGNNSGTINQANAYAEIIYYGPQNSGSVISDTAWQVYVSADGKTGYLFWKYNDYSECNVQVINSAFTLSNGAWMTSIGSGYGVCKAKTSINPSYTTQRVTDSGNGTWTSLAYSKSGMNYGDYTWLAGWNNYELRAVNKNQFATAGHDHDLNKMINAQLSEGTSDPQDNDYYISQYAGGGTTTTTYHRRPVKALWNYIKGKTDAAYLKLTGGTISGRITRDSGGSWISSRDQVAVFGTKSSKDSFNPVVGQKTPNGAWAMGNLGSDERLCFGYTTDANYNAGSNNAVQVWLPAQAGTIITSATIGSQTVSKAGTADKLGTDAGSATQPVYFKDGKPVAGTYTLGNASSKTVRTLTAAGAAGWKDLSTDQGYVPDMSFMAYWNGAYSDTSSNLQYCDRGRFGTIITKGSGDYLPIGGGTLTGDLKFSDIGDTATSHKISWAGSTDGADIYYQTTAKDQGNLVLNLCDDANCYLRIASNGAFKSYFSPSDGNFHGNVNGNATSASGYTFKSQTSDPGANSSLATGTVLFVYE